MKTFVLGIICAILTGCSSLREIATNIGVPEKAAKAIDRYCEEVPHVERLKNRAEVNALTVKGDIAITCEGDQ